MAWSSCGCSLWLCVMSGQIHEFKKDLLETNILMAKGASSSQLMLGYAFLWPVTLTASAADRVALTSLYISTWEELRLRLSTSLLSAPRILPAFVIASLSLFFFAFVLQIICETS